MKYISETHALDRLADLQTDLRSRIRGEFEHRAKDCLTCTTQGACCLDAHFVNVRITRLEAEWINRSLKELGAVKFDEVSDRINNAIKTYGLSAETASADEKFACPLFEKGTGCLVHYAGKPGACVVHACYENAEDVPPDELLQEYESKIARLNERTYGGSDIGLPIPLAVKARS